MSTQLPGMPGVPGVHVPQPLVGPGAPSLSDGTTPVDIIASTHSLLRALTGCADRCSADASAVDAKDYGMAALYFAQAIITLDPSRLQGGNAPAAVRAAAPITAPPPVTPPIPPTTDRNHDGVISQ